MERSHLLLPLDAITKAPLWSYAGRWWFPSTGTALTSLAGFAAWKAGSAGHRFIPQRIIAEIGRPGVLKQTSALVAPMDLYTSIALVIALVWSRSSFG